MRKTILDRVTQVVVEQLGIDESQVKPESYFIADLGADSLDMVELVMSLEDEFGVEIPDAEAESIRTVAEAVAYIETRAGE